MSTPLRMIIAEDDSILREMFVLILRRFRPDVHLIPAATGVHAYALYEQHGADLILTNDQMPLMGGTALLHTLRTRGVTIPAILLSGWTEARDAIAHDVHTIFAAKPILLEEFLTLVNTMLPTP